MAAFEYFSTIDEWWSPVEHVLDEHGLRAAVDRWYPQPKSECYRSLCGAVREEILSTRRSLFMVGDKYSKLGLYFDKQETGPRAGEYSIDIVRGGPSIRMHMPAEFEERGLLWLGAATVTFQKLYWNDSLTRAYPPTKELKNAFGAIKRTLQNDLSERTVARKKVWVSPKAWELFEHGKAALPVAGKCYAIHGEVPPPTLWRMGPVERLEPTPAPPGEAT